MADQNRKNDWTILGAVALIVLGVWLLLGRIGGPWWAPINAVFQFIMTIAWPLALIAGGVLLLIAGKRGTIGSVDVRGKRLYRSRSDRMIGGVLGGLGTYLGIDPTWVRIAYVILAVLTSFGPAILVYVLAMIIVPEEPKQAPEAPVWPQPEPQGRETVQTPPPPPPVPNATVNPPAPPVPPTSEAPPASPAPEAPAAPPQE